MNDNENVKYISIFLVTIFFLSIVSLFIYFSSKRQVDISVTDENTPPAEEIIVSNVSSNSAVVSWYTNIDTIGYVKIGETTDNIDTEIYTLSDSSNTKTPKKIHYARLTGLKENQEYYFEIYINSQVFTKEEGQLFTFKTFESTELATPKTLKISLPSNFSNGVIYAHASNGQTISSVSSTNSSGNNALIQLSNLRNDSGEEFNLEEAGLFISALSDSGERFSDIVEISDEIINITSTSTTLAYDPSLIFQPKNIVATELPNTQQETPVVVPTPTPTVQQPQNQTPTNINSSQNENLPNTSLNGGTLLAIAPIIFGISLIALGSNLLNSRHTEKYA